ncbi:MAG TPA: response regulator transcription factor [Burkholderiaceae bacterium]|nr:response regulator transcription factor [Burkholderiaceae bacterium]
MSLKVLIVDDHPLMRGALRIAAESLSEAVEIAMAGTLAEALAQLRGPVAHDLIILDLTLPDARGIEALQRLRDLHPEIAVTVISGDTERSTILRCLDAGACGFIPKSASHERTITALRQVLTGGVYLPPEAAARQDFATMQPPSVPFGADPRQLGLTERQMDVLRLLLQGLPNKLICRRLELAEGTVKVHVSAVLRALGVRTRTQAVVAAARLGLKFRDPPEKH